MKIYILLFLFLASCLSAKAITSRQAIKNADNFRLDSLDMFDKARNRKIPVVFYSPITNHKKQQVVILSHGYGKNEGGSNLTYSYLTESLASKGYFVVSIQHELPTDELLAMEGNLQITRRPNWDRGVENIYFVLSELKKTKPELDYDHVTLIGHSNGGDMSVLFAHKYPELIDKIISMDNRRMPLPRISKPKIYTLRCDDYPADEGVLPTEQEQREYGITVQFVPINHGSMDNKGTPEERSIMIESIEKYLNE